MADLDTAVQEVVARVASPVRRRDAGTLLELMSRVTGEPPRAWGSIVGFGCYHYRYASGREGDAPAASFAARKAATTIYLPDGTDRYEAQLERLGPHTTGVSCLYLKDLAQVDLTVLEAIVTESYRRVTDGTYTERAREGAADSGSGA